MTEEKKPKKGTVACILILGQILLMGLVLCIFALFHHVIPRWRQENGEGPVPIGTVQRQGQPSPSPVPLQDNDPATASGAGEEPAAETAAEPEEVPETWQTRFAEHFSEEPVWTKNEYSSPNIAVTVTEYKHPEAYPEMTYYVADVYIADISSFVIGFPQYATYDDPHRIVKNYDGVIAINSDEMLVQQSGGLLIRNGEIYSDLDNGGDLCVLYYDGSMETYIGGSFTAEDILEKEPLHSWQFGPALLDENGLPLEEFNITAELTGTHPRTALGYYEPGHYCFVVIDGRDPPRSKGADIWELAEILSGLGCKQAYNLDGGASSMILFRGETVNTPLRTGQKLTDRFLNDMIIITEPKGEEQG